jgi:hypothetical protein
MTIEQTIDIPANREVTIRLVAPESVPCGRRNVIVEFPTGPTEHKLHTVKLFPNKKPGMTPQEALDRLSGMFEGSKFTVDALLEERRRDLEREKE